MCGPKPYGSFFQYFTAFLANFLTISYGFMFGLTPPTLLLYKSDSTPLTNGPLSNESISWITALLFLGAASGAVFFKHLSYCFGPRATLLLAGIMQNLGWFAAAFGYNFTHICISRLIVGLSGGAALTVIPMFLIEISLKKNPHNPHIFTFIAHNLGFLIGLIFGTFTENVVAAIVGLVISVFFSLSFPFVQESPDHYLKQNNIIMLEKSLRYFRAIRDLDQRSLPEFLAEVDKFKQKRQTTNSNNSKKLDHTNKEIATKSMSCCEILRSFVSCLVLTITSQLCGLFVILNYSSIILANIGVDMPAGMASLLLALATLFGSILSIFIAKCIWRKVILVSFSLLTGLCLGCLGYFIKETWIDDDDSHLEWIVLVCLILVTLLPSASIYPMTFIVMEEEFPHKTMDILKTFYHALHWVLGLLLIKFYFCIVHCVGMQIYFWIFGSVCLIQCLVLVFILPRKQQKNL